MTLENSVVPKIPELSLSLKDKSHSNYFPMKPPKNEVSNSIGMSSQPLSKSITIKQLFLIQDSLKNRRSLGLSLDNPRSLGIE